MGYVVVALGRVNGATELVAEGAGQFTDDELFEKWSAITQNGREEAANKPSSKEELIRRLWRITNRI